LAKDDLYQHCIPTSLQVPEYFNIAGVLWPLAEDRRGFALYTKTMSARWKNNLLDLQHRQPPANAPRPGRAPRRPRRPGLPHPQTIAAHIACYPDGAVAMPMSICRAGRAGYACTTARRAS